MKILMLGWEYPPHISGGLGTACEGLTTAVASRGIEIDFLVPRLFGEEDAPHMQLLDAASEEPRTQDEHPPAVVTTRQWAELIAAEPALATDPIFVAAVEAATMGMPNQAGSEIRTIRVPAML